VIISKGDLVLLSNEGSAKTCIILSSKYIFGSERVFYYTYCLETGEYGIVYETEIECIVAKEFDPDFKFDSELFDEENCWYDILISEYGYWWPRYWQSSGLSEDDDSEDE
jgi:hypothetical protein